MTALERLRLGDNHIGPDGALALRGLARLGRLRLSRNPLDDAARDAIARLPALTYLHLDRAAIGGVGAARLAALPQLRYLSMRQNRIDPDGVRALIRRLGAAGSCRTLELDGNPGIETVLPPDVVTAGSIGQMLAALDAPAA